jgi:hypothetical protein
MKIGKKVGGVVATGLLFAGCGAYSDKYFDDRQGDIVAGIPTTVESVWSTERSTGKSGANGAGYVLYLSVEDCPAGVQPGEGKAVADRCKVKSYEVSANTYRDFKDGGGLQWEDRKGPSQVQEHLAAWTDESHTDVYNFALLVKQCVKTEGVEPSKACVTDFVEVNLDTWFNANNGDTITFGGEAGKVVS